MSETTTTTTNASKGKGEGVVKDYSNSTASMTNNNNALTKFPCWSIGLCISHIVVILFSIIAMKSVLFEFGNINEALAFYGTYHSHPMNQVIHFFGVPVIAVTIFIFMSHLPLLPITISFLPGIQSHYINWSTFWALSYLLFYLTIDPFSGTLYAGVIYIMYALGIYYANQNLSSSANSSSSNTSYNYWNGTTNILKYNLYLHILMWYMQIHWGHKIFEGGSPALAKSLGGALTSGPLFAFYEGLWLLGINKELQTTTFQLVASYAKEMCDTNNSSVMHVCQAFTS